MAKDNPNKSQDIPGTAAPPVAPVDDTELDETALDAVNGGFISDIINEAMSIHAMKEAANKPGFLNGAAGNAVKNLGDGIKQAATKG